VKFPKQTRIDWENTHRLIPYRFSDRHRPVLDNLAQGDDDFLSDLTELEGATNDRLLGESGRLPGISAIELVSGFRFAHIVNATFTHANSSSGRFHVAGRGAWYAGREFSTAKTEVSFHRARELQEVAWEEEEVSPYLDYLADFHHEFHDLRANSHFANCLDAGSYAASQTLAINLLTNGSAGVVFPSVRRKAGNCIACFRPPLVLNVREGPMVTFTFANAHLKSTSQS
jgi:hypothetical protein